MPESSNFLTSVQKDIASVSKDYDELKETLSVCLPPHLLKQSDLPERIEKWVRLLVYTSNGVQWNLEMRTP